MIWEVGLEADVDPGRAQGTAGQQGAAEQQHQGYGYLEDDERLAQLETAAILQATLKEAAGKLEQGSQEFERIEDSAKTRLTESSLQPDYFSICHATTLEPATTADKSLVILAAAWLGKTRLIDNIIITLS